MKEDLRGYIQAAFFMAVGVLIGSDKSTPSSVFMSAFWIMILVLGSWILQQGGRLIRSRMRGGDANQTPEQSNTNQSEVEVRN